MRTNAKRIATALTAAGLAAALVTPMVATAAPGQAGSLGVSARGRMTAAAGTMKTQAMENLKKRIENVLRARKARMDAVIANLNLRIDRVSAIADRVEKAGGDVSAARESLDSAKEHMAKAESLEQAAVDAFNGIPSASNRREAFRAARAQGRLVPTEIKLARDDVRAAAKALRDVIAQLKAQATQ